MKTITKKLAALGIVGAGLIVGCAENNEKTVMTDPNTGKSQGGGVTPPNAPRNSKDFMKANPGMMNDPTKAAAYKDATK